MPEGETPVIKHGRFSRRTLIKGVAGAVALGAGLVIGEALAPVHGDPPGPTPSRPLETSVPQQSPTTPKK